MDSKKKLKCKCFEFAEDVTRFVNANNIPQEDIQSICGVGLNEAKYWYTLYFWATDDKGK